MPEVIIASAAWRMMASGDRALVQIPLFQPIEGVSASRSPATIEKPATSHVTVSCVQGKSIRARAPACDP